MILDNKLFDEILLKAVESPRMLNVLMSDTVIPVHRHNDTSETVIVCLEDGSVVFEAKDRAYDPEGTEVFCNVVILHYLCSHGRNLFS